MEISIEANTVAPRSTPVPIVIGILVVFINLSSMSNMHRRSRIDLTRVKCFREKRQCSYLILSMTISASSSGR